MGGPTLPQLSSLKFIIFSYQMREGRRNVFRRLARRRVGLGFGKGYGGFPPRRLIQEFNSTVYKDCFQPNYRIAESRPAQPGSPAHVPRFDPGLCGLHRPGQSLLIPN